MGGMKVYFIAASTTFRQYQHTYRKIVNSIISNGHDFWPHKDLHTYAESIGDGTLDHDDWQVLCDRELEMARTCDVGIFDATNKATFGVGYLAGIALEARKPILLLLREGSLEGSIISGLQHPLLQRAHFNEGNVGEIVADFLGKHAEHGVRV